MSDYHNPYSPSYFSPIDSPLHDQDPRRDAVRKRPKYTRSKLGCLTCRAKKVKCDEQHPVCTRCSQSQRQCTWPDAPPPKRKSSTRRHDSDDRPSTADSDRVSNSSTPSIQGDSPKLFHPDRPYPSTQRSNDSSFQPLPTSQEMLYQRRFGPTNPTYPSAHNNAPQYGPTSHILQGGPSHPALYNNPATMIHAQQLPPYGTSYYPPPASSETLQPQFTRPGDTTLPPLNLARYHPQAAHPGWPAQPPISPESEPYYRSSTSGHQQQKPNPHTWTGMPYGYGK